MKAGDIPNKYWIAADDAYICTENIITPIPGKSTQLSEAEDGFNYFQSSHRMHIEQAFGIMMARWGILWKPLCFSLARNVRVIQLAMVLHNFCVENQDTRSDDLMSESEFAQVQAYLQVQLNGNNGRRGRIRSSTTSHLRDSLLHIVEEQGVRRLHSY